MMDIMPATPMAVGPAHRARRVSEPNAVLAARIDLTPSMAIFRVRPYSPSPPFEPGQYLALGISIDGRLIQRPYSTSSPAGTTDELEFLIRLVPGGTFTPFLWALPTGAPVHLGPPKGLFRTDTGDTRTHLFIATGTGLAPFVSMIRSSLTRASPPRTIVVHGVSRLPELAYRDLLGRWERDLANSAYRPVLSRPPAPTDGHWTGYRGRLDATLGPICDELEIDPRDTVVYACGNPAMITATATLLHRRGFPAEAVRSEGYWVA